MTHQMTELVDRESRVEFAEDVSRLLDRPSSLHEPLVVGGSLDLAVGNRFTKLIKRNLVEIFGNGLEPLRETPEIAHRSSPSAEATI